MNLQYQAQVAIALEQWALRFRMVAPDLTAIEAKEIAKRLQAGVSDDRAQCAYRLMCIGFEPYPAVSLAETGLSDAAIQIIIGTGERPAIASERRSSRRPRQPKGFGR